MKTVVIEIRVDYENDVTEKELSEISEIVDMEWLYHRSLNLESNWCKCWETKVNLVE